MKLGLLAGLLAIFGYASIPLLFIETAAAQPPSPPPPPAGYLSMIFLILLLVCALALFLIWKMKSRGAKLGVIWGLMGPIIYWVLADSNLPGVKTILQIIALPMFIYSKIIPEAAPGGSFYYSPIIIFPISIVVGTLIGYALEKVYGKIKREMPQMEE